MSKRNKSNANASNPAAIAFAKWEKARDTFFALPDDKRTQTARATFQTATLGALPMIRKWNPELGKKMRSRLRQSGHRISDVGYIVSGKAIASANANANAETKRTRKAKVRKPAKVVTETTIDPTIESDANAETNANA